MSDDVDLDLDPRREHSDAAAAVRRLGHALVARATEPELLDEITSVLNSLSDRVERAAKQPRMPNTAKSFYTPPTKTSPPEHKNLFRESIISGDLNALGVAADVWREDDVAVLEVVLGPAFEGAPGRSHGGVVAAMIDETMGIVLAIHSEAAYTGKLNITYRAGTPVGRPVTVRSWLTHREGRKLFMAAEVTDGETLCAEAEAVFIVVDRSAFVDPEGEPSP